MGDLALRVAGLGKRYVIGAGPRHELLRDRLAAFLRPRRRSSEPPPTIWALRDVSFEVAAGEVVGIIGGNGAGKSTLLKVLSRITEPTEGEAEVTGRVGSLLEVGTGFHPELTGRDNVFLNGAILGLSRAETASRFDEIVAFAEVERFIDTPVKHYSSGMYVRLAFAVAAQMQPEILVVDEVLAVGDARFQKKCLGKMDDVARSGRTVLFVSHNMAAIQRLCTRTLLLESGRLVDAGDTREVVGRYLSGDARPRYAAAIRPGWTQIVSVELQTPGGAPVARALTHEPITVAIDYTLGPRTADVHVGIGVLTVDGVPIFTSESRDCGLVAPAGEGRYLARVTIPGDTFLAGDVHVAVCLWDPGGTLDLQEPALTFSIDAGPSLVYRESGTRKGVVQVPCPWTIAAAGPPAPEGQP